jgi:undecaprenyl diphosphate synthase
VEQNVPKHIGLILDGNRRWAKAQGLPTLEGHRQGYKNLETITDAAQQRGVEYISAYIFSTENWSRAKDEVGYLMDLALKMVTHDLKHLHEKGVRVVWAGSKERVSAKLLKAIQNAERTTKDNTGITLVLCFNYGGQREIAEAVQRIISEGVEAADITEELIAKYLYHPEVPPIDLIIRTSGEQRISNFMLWRAAYSELYFIDKHWPAFTPEDLDEALAEYARRGRRFGG